MTCLEHLIKNGLCEYERLQKSKTDDMFKKWNDIMAKDVNFEGVKLSLSELWYICQYIKCTWCMNCEKR